MPQRYIKFLILKNKEQKIIIYNNIFYTNISLTPFGGIYLTNKAFNALSLGKVINETLGRRRQTYNGYQWDEIVFALLDVYLCGDMSTVASSPMTGTTARRVSSRHTLQQGHRVQQFPLAIAYRRAKSEDRAKRASHSRRTGLVPRLLARRPLRPYAHAKRTPAGPPPERPGSNGCLRFLHQDDGERVRG